MEYVNLGSSGVKVSRICLGTMTYGAKRWRSGCWRKPRRGRSSGTRSSSASTSSIPPMSIRSASAKRLLGRALKDFGPPRDRLVVATKVFYPMGDDPNQRGLSRKHIMHAIDDSLRRLGHGLRRSLPDPPL